MKTSLILCSAAVMAALVPATLFAQTAPVQSVAAAPAATTAHVSIPPTVADPKALAAPPVAATAAFTAKMTTVATRPATKRSATKRAAVTSAVRKVASTTTAAKSVSVASSSSDLSTARSVLASLKATYKYLDGVTVEMGTTPGGYQAVSYFTRGRILISTRHTASISRILKHEIWHIIDWRDNGKIDWRESVPPHNAADYFK
jgi:hypothetical protein